MQSVNAFIQVLERADGHDQRQRRANGTIDHRETDAGGNEYTKLRDK